MSGFAGFCPFFFVTSPQSDPNYLQMLVDERAELIIVIRFREAFGMPKDLLRNCRNNLRGFDREAWIDHSPAEPQQKSESG